MFNLMWLVKTRNKVNAMSVKFIVNLFFPFICGVCMCLCIHVCMCVYMHIHMHTFMTVRKQSVGLFFSFLSCGSKDQSLNP